MEDFHHMLSNTLDILEDFNQMSHIHMLLKPIHVFTDQKSQLLTAEEEATTSLKETKLKWLKDFTMLAQSLFHSKLLLDLKTMQEVFTLLQIAERPLKMLTTLFWLLDLVLIKELNSGTLKIHGEQAGVLKDISKWKEMLICVL